MIFETFKTHFTYLEQYTSLAIQLLTCQCIIFSMKLIKNNRENVRYEKYSKKYRKDVQNIGKNLIA